VRYVLDTNVVARLLDEDESILGRLADVDPRDVGIPLVVYAELLFGAEKSARRVQNLARIQTLIERVRLLVLRQRSPVATP
jgi:tRNA(fMet)-specific endonuclease VapC